MTAEVAVMNTLAVALAADSAVTVGESKTHNTANKLFALSRREPVGIMIYGAADLLGVPWETVVKVFRSKLGNRSFGTLSDYVGAFIKFLDDQNPLFSTEEQARFFADVASSFFAAIREDITCHVDNQIRLAGQVTLSEVMSITKRTMDDYHNRYGKEAPLPSLPKSFRQSLSRRYSSILLRLKDRIFEQLPMPKGCLARLKKTAINLFISGNTSAISSVVVAGFGQRDVYPSVSSFKTAGKVGGRLLYGGTSQHAIHSRSRAYVSAFAQPDVVSAFMDGVDPSRRKGLDATIWRLLVEDYPNAIAQSIRGLKGGARNSLLKALQDEGTRLCKNFGEEMNRQEGAHSQSIVRLVASLPKDELAAMAESLVNLTALKRKLSEGAESVGGPIDVAVVSKGDGFVWVKRKHYFTPELNPQFFATHYGGREGRVR